MMVEICPFSDVETFQKDPVENMTGVMGLLYLGGVRVTHSYFSADYSDYAPQFQKLTGYLKQDDANRFNEYVGRLGYMLDGIMNDCNTFVYYGVEDVQAKMQPAYSAFSGPETEADRSTVRLTRTIYEAGYDFYYADREDLVDAARSLAQGGPVISGCAVRTVLVPALDVVYDETLEALAALQKAGVAVLFLDKLPRYGAELNSRTDALTAGFQSCRLEDMLTHLAGRGDPFTAEAEGVMLIKARYNRDGKEMYFVDNNTRAAADVLLRHAGKTSATLYNPVDGSVRPVRMGERVRIPSFRGVFVVFD